MSGIKRLLLSALLLPLTGGAVIRAAEFEILDRFSVDGYTVLRGSADIPGGSFTVGASTLVVKGGNVGIGTAAPGHRLHVTGDNSLPTNGFSGEGVIRIEGTNAAVLDIGQNSDAAPYGGWLQAYDNRSENSTTYPIVINPIGGNVGIGTTNPGSTLDVTGVIHASSYISAGADIIGYSNVQVRSGTSFIAYNGSNDAYSYIKNTAVSGQSSLTLGTGSTDRITILNAGNVGIGTVTPANKLTIMDSRDTSGYLATAGITPNVMINNQSAVDGQGAYLQLAQNDHASAGIVVLREDAVNYWLSNMHFLVRDSGATHKIVMTLKNTGNVGIGTTAPGNLLEIYKVPATNTTLQPMLTLNSDYGSAAGTGFGGSIVFKGRTAGDFLQDNAQIAAYNENSGDNGYALGFYTRPTVAGGLIQRMMIARYGNVGIGTTNPGAKLEVQGTISQATGTGYAKRIVTSIATPAINTWYETGLVLYGYQGFSAFINAIFEDDNADGYNRAMLAHAGGYGIGGEVISYLSRPNGVHIELQFASGHLQIRQTNDPNVGGAKMTVLIDYLTH